jgi:hypothetical protein
MITPMPDAGATEEDVEFYRVTLQDGTHEDRALSLQALARTPTRDPRVRAAIEPLLEDSSPCVVQIPYRFGEVRYLAGAALAAERCAAGVGEPVRLRCTLPVTTDELETIRTGAVTESGLTGSDPVHVQLGWFARLRSLGLLSEIEVEFSCSGMRIVR